MRLSRYLAHCGIASRRTIDAWIAQGRLQHGGALATLGQQHSPGAAVMLDGQELILPQDHGKAKQPQVLLYHKPTGQMCTRSDPQGRPTVFESLPSVESGRWVAVGRLDFQTSGLLLFVSDGELAHQLMHPRYEWDRVYHVKAQGAPQAALKRLEAGVELDGHHIAIEGVKLLQQLPKSYWAELTLRSGRYRAVRRIFESVGQRVVKLKRVQYAGIVLPENLAEGQCKELSVEEIKSLKENLAKGGT